MTRFTILYAAASYLAACAEHGEVVDSNENEIKLKIGYDAAVNNVTTKPTADEHCEDEGKKAEPDTIATSTCIISAYRFLFLYNPPKQRD
jgi:hypothetical protein